MNPTTKSLCTSSLIARRLSSSKRRRHCFTGLDVKGVLGDLPRYARHVRGAPQEDVCIGAEEVDEHHFLFVIEDSADLQCLAVGGVRIEEYVLGTLGRLEAACVSLRGVHGLVRHPLQVRGEGLVHSKGLSMLDAFDVALVGLLERGADGDDTLWTRHLHLEVGVVGDHNELGIARL